jgi:hypothetical protein
MAIGRISGQMLKANLLRSGTDLAFETNLLVLDVTNSFVGVGTASPSRKLHINDTGAIRLPSGTTAERGTPANGDIRYNTDDARIEGYTNGGWASLVAGGESLANVVEDTTPQLGGNLDVNGNDIVSTSNADINITPDGTGTVVISKADINEGTLDNVDIGASTAATGLTVSGATVSITDTGGDGTMDGVIIGGSTAAAGTFTNLTANGTIDIDSSGNIDGITIGANTAAAGNFTTLDATGNLTVGGNLTVSGTTTTVDSETLVIEDPFLTLAKNNSGGSANTFDQGLLFNRGSLDNVSFVWDESADQFAVAVTSGEDGTTAGNVTIDSYAAFKAGVITGTDVETGSISAADGTEAATIADSTGVMTIASSVLTTTDINGGTIDGTTIGGSTPAAGTFTNGTIATADINGGAIDGTTIGASTPSSAVFTTAETSSTLKVNADSTNFSVGAGDDFTIQHDGTNTLIANSTGQLHIDGAAGSEVVFNELGADVDFRVEGDTVSHLIYADAGNDRIGLGSSNPQYFVDMSQNTDAIALPTGTTAERPSASTGVLRFNTNFGAYEGSIDGSTWVQFAVAGDTPIFSKASTTGDGSTTTFTGFFAEAPANANNVFVYIDNVYQEPTENYTVSGTNITFTSAPHSGARIFAITGADNTALASGGVKRSETATVNFESTATTIMSFNAGDYRSAELTIQLTDAGNSEYSIQKAHVVHNGTTAFISVYGITNTSGADMATFTATHDGSNTVNIQATSTGGGTGAKVQYSLIGL